MYTDSYSDEIEFMGSGFRGRGGGRVQAARRTPFVAPADVIEVSSDDDDDEEPQAGPSVQRRPAETRNNPLFLSDSEDDDEEEARVAPLAPMAAGAPPPENAQESMDLNDYYVAKVLDIIPDVDPAYVTGLVQQSEGDVVGQVVNILLENPDYPKAQNKGKGKRKRDGEDQGEEGSSGASKAVKIDYASKDRQRLGGPLYYELAIEQLRADFPFIPMAHIRRTFTQQNVFYAPTYLALEAELRSGQLPYQRLTNGSASSRARVKGKQADRVDEELEKEKRWIFDKAEADRVARDKQLAEQLQDAEDCQIECGCCFSEYPLRKMIQCPDAHLFCRDCMTHYSETKLGEHDISIVCMDQSGCKLAFHEDELKKFLSEKLLELYYRVKQRKEIEAAGVENLEECPFCDYKVIIENPHEKLFRCARDDCGVVSCRACKKPDHLPKSCQEAESDKTLDARHAVEEAMTRALLRNCPSCSKAFMKEAGCNKMTCPNCKTLSCYICRKIIKGYDHFNQMPGNSPVTDPNKCPLWDHVNIEQRHADEVAAAAKKALEELKRANPGVDEKELQVELPKAAVAGPSNVAARPGVQVVVGGGGGAVVVGGGAHHVHVHHHAAPAPAAGAVHHGLNAQVEQQRLVALRQQFERERQLVRARNQEALARAHAHAQAHAQAAQAQRPVRGLPLRANAVRPPAAPAPVAQQHRAGHMPQITVRMNGQPVMPQELPGGAMLYVMDGRMQPVQVPPPVPAPAAAAVAVAAQRRRRR